MTEREVWELDVWIAENVFDVEVARDANGEPYNAKCVIGSVPFGWIPQYTTDDRWLGKIKREIERRGWSWQASGGPVGKWYKFVIWDHVRSGSDGEIPQIGWAEAATEGLAGCLAMKEAMT